MKKPRPFLAEKRTTPTKVRGRVDICNKGIRIGPVHSSGSARICNQRATRDNVMSGQQHAGNGVVTPILAAFLAYSPNRTRPRRQLSPGALSGTSSPEAVASAQIIPRWPFSSPCLPTHTCRCGTSLLIFVLRPATNCCASSQSCAFRASHTISNHFVRSKFCIFSHPP